MISANLLDTSLEIRWVHRRADLEPVYDEWRSLAGRTNADTYLTPDWFDTWWDHFGANSDLACITAWHEDMLVGVMPFSLETIRIGPLSYRIAKIAGTDPHCIVLNLPIEEGWALSVMYKALHYLLYDKGCDLVSFTPVSEKSNLMPLIRKSCLGEADLNLLDKEMGSHILFDLPDSFELFLKKISKKRRAQFRRDLKLLHNKEATSSFVVNSDYYSFMEFVRLHNYQWQVLGKGGHFSDWAGSEEFYSALARRLKGQKNLQFHILSGREGCLAMQFSLVSGSTCHWRLPARSLDASIERFGVGKIGLLLMIKQLISQGVTQVEGGMGDYDYKRTWGGSDIPVRQFMVSSTNFEKNLRVLLMWANFLDLFYYRVWFLKLAPYWRRLTGAKAKPLWRVWIKTRL